MSWFWTRNKATTKEIEQRSKITESQRILLDAAVSTADMAQFVTTKLKQSLEDAVKQFEAATSIMSDSLLVCDVDGSIRACNPAAIRTFGCDSTEIMKKNIIDLFLLNGKIITKADEIWGSFNTHTGTLSGIRSHSVDFSVDVNMTKLGKADGSVVMLMLIRDTTDINALKKEVDEHAKRYRALFDLSFDGIIVVQHDKIVVANQQAGRLFGVRPESLVTVQFTKLVNKDEQEKLEHIYKEPITAMAMRPDGKSMTLLFSGTSITWKDDKAYLITIRDLMLKP